MGLVRPLSGPVARLGFVETIVVVQVLLIWEPEHRGSKGSTDAPAPKGFGSAIIAGSYQKPRVVIMDIYIYVYICVQRYGMLLELMGKNPVLSATGSKNPPETTSRLE